jgi:putative transposase
VRYIDTDKEEFGVEPICRVLQVAPSTYYAAKSRPVSTRALSDERLGKEIQRVHDENYGVYGVRKVCTSCSDNKSKSDGTRWGA